MGASTVFFFLNVSWKKGWGKKKGRSCRSESSKRSCTPNWCARTALHVKLQQRICLPRVLASIFDTTRALSQLTPHSTLCRLPSRSPNLNSFFFFSWLLLPHRLSGFLKLTNLLSQFPVSSLWLHATTISGKWFVSCFVYGVNASSRAQPQADNALISDAEEHSRTLNCIPVLRFRIFNSWTDAYSIICNYNQTGAPNITYGDCTVTATGAPFNDAYRYVSGRYLNYILG